jgi:hypothetical protein
MITPGAGPCTADGCDFFITADFIYWAVRQDHMGFAFSVPSDPFSQAAVDLGTGEYFHPKGRGEPGFKIGVGWLTDCDGWDVYLNYTWLRGRTSTKTVTPASGFTLFDANFTFGTLTVAEGNSIPQVSWESAKWDLDFNVLVFDWGRNFYISQCLHMRPFFGLKGTWQDQKLETAGVSVDPQTGDTNTSSGNHKSDFGGVGPRAGLNTTWHFSRCFSVLGEVAASAIWGKFDSKSVVVASIVGGTSSVTTLQALPTANLETSFHSVKPVMEFLLGVRWEDWWCCDEYYTSLDLGWEVQWWGGQNQFVFSHTETRWGDLGLQGLTLRARFQF